MRLNLTYLVEIEPPYTPDALRHDIAIGLADMIGTPLASHVIGGQNTIAVSYTRVPSNDAYQFLLTLDAAALGLGRAGFPRVLTMIFGNPFRHEGLRSVYLTRFDFDGACEHPFVGPFLGLDGLRSRLDSPTGPLIAVPIPSELNVNERAHLARILVKSGVRILSHSPVDTPTAQSLDAELTAYSKIAAELNTSFSIFANLTIALQGFLDCTSVLTAFDDPNVLAGARICPLSFGLSGVSYLRERDIPIYGYNLLQLGVGARALSIGALIQLLRLAGCDLINVGLHTSSILGRPEAGEMYSAMMDVSELPRVGPVFTGGITPRVAHAIISEFGTNVVLHIKKPLLADGVTERSLSANINALREAIEIAARGISIDEAFQSEARDTRAWRHYEQNHVVN